MASQVCETLAFINGDVDGVRGMEVLEINGALLMSLMEESPSDESDDERLDSLIRSFEAEIGGSKMGAGHDSACTGSQLTMMTSIEEGTELWNMGQMEGQDYWASSSSDEFGVEYMDLVPSSPLDDGSWGIDPCGDERDVMVDNLKVCDGFDIEEYGYNSFWQDNYEMQLVQ